VDAPPPPGGWGAPPPGGPFTEASGYGYGQGYGGYGTGYGAMPGYGHAYGFQPQQDKGATTSLVLGICALVLCNILGIFALLEGRKSRQRIRESNGYLTGDSMALTGMILGGVALGLMVLSIVLVIIVVALDASY
jgi:hypothetical protein